MLSKCAEHNLQSLSMRVYLFGALVAPILSYCSEVWGPQLLSKGGTGRPASVLHMFNNPQHTVQFEFLRSLGGHIRRSIPRLLLLREFGTQPLAYQWFKSMTDFWNKVADRSSSHPFDWLVLAMRENIQLSFSSGVISAHVQSSLWAYQFRKVINLLNEPLLLSDDASFASLVTSTAPLPPVDVDQAKKAFHQHVFQPILNAPDNPRMASSTEVIYSTYETWFASTPFGELQAEPAAAWSSQFHALGGISKSHLLSMLRFRLGAHDLRVMSGRWEGRTGVPRPQRLCERCSQQTVEDEFHMVFECDAYECVRERYPTLFLDDFTPVGRSMAAFMDQDVHQVAAFIHDCLLTRVVGVDPVDLDDDVSVSTGDDSECFMSAVSDGSLPDSESADEFASCSSHDDFD
jgi:hypothetical protein